METQNDVLNHNLLKYQKDIYLALKNNDLNSLKIEINDNINLNFDIEVEKGMFYTPLMYCAANGRSKCMKILLTNKSLIINQNQQMSGVNAFWIAAYFGHSECLKLLSKSGIFLFSKQLKTNCNPLHAAILRKHYSVADQIILLQKT